MLILSSTDRLMEVIREELEIVRDNFGDERRTEIIAAVHDMDMEELIAQEMLWLLCLMQVTLSIKS